MNNIYEIKEMLDKLNEELENLRAENAELKLCLEKDKSSENTDMTKEMFDKPNVELENLRVENAKLKLRLAKYETVEKKSCNTGDLQELMSVSLPILGQYVSRFFNALSQIGYKTVEDCKKLSIADILNLPGVGIDTAAIGIAILEVYGGIHFNVNRIPRSKVKKPYTPSHYSRLCRRISCNMQVLKEERPEKF
ncbi:MAG: hypothetical protein J6N78_07020 [Clostridia bacterium]|nr:hypothetical protein [Clostridia bacterium]